MYLLKQYDTILMRFDITVDSLEGQSCNIVSVNEQCMHLLPIGLRTTNDGLMSWLRSRVIPKKREFSDALLAKNGLSHNDIKGIIDICKGLSLNDSYWIVDQGFEGKFKDYNLYENDFVRALSLIAYTGYGSSRASGFTSSPEFTTNGNLRKGWRRLNQVVKLFKGGTSGGANTGNEPYSEFFASQIAEQMGINHVPYGLSMWKHSLCSTCELFSDIDHSYVPMYRFLEKPTLRSTAEFLRNINEECYLEYIDMLIFDSLIYNEDRHYGNFGLMVDNKSNQPYAFAPLFDHGISLFNQAMPSDLDHLDDYAKTRTSHSGASFDAIAEEFITNRQKEKLRKLIGFKLANHKTYPMPAERKKAIENLIQRRVQYLLSLEVKHDETSR